MNTMDVNPPFTDKEKRFVLAEAIKTSNVPIDRLIPLIYDGSMQPDWNQMLLPYGRNMQSCRDMFAQLRPSQAPPAAHSFFPQPYQGPAMTPKPATTKRKPPPENLETTGGHDQKRRLSDMNQHMSILPKPSNISPQYGSPNTQGKKRGRPSKAAVAQRDAEAIARGEVIAPPRTSSLRGETPGGGERMIPPVYANIAPMLSPRPMGSPIASSTYDSPSFVGSESSSPKKKRAPAKKAPKPGETSFSVASPRMGAERMGDQIRERTGGERSTYPSIISSLTDTIPGGHTEYAPYRPPPPLQPPAPSLAPSILPPPPNFPPPNVNATLPPPPPRTDP